MRCSRQCRRCGCRWSPLTSRVPMPSASSVAVEGRAGDVLAGLIEDAERARAVRVVAGGAGQAGRRVGAARGGGEDAVRAVPFMAETTVWPVFSPRIGLDAPPWPSLTLSSSRKTKSPPPRLADPVRGRPDRPTRCGSRRRRRGREAEVGLVGNQQQVGVAGPRERAAGAAVRLQVHCDAVLAIVHRVTAVAVGDALSWKATAGAPATSTAIAARINSLEAFIESTSKVDGGFASG